MTSFVIDTIGGTPAPTSTTFVDTTPDGGIVIDFFQLDNGFNVTVNGVDLFIGGPTDNPNELEFQTASTDGQTVRFADGDVYGTDTPQIWQMGLGLADPTEVIVRLQINPDGTIVLMGAKSYGGPLEPLELFNGMTVNTAAIAAAWDDAGSNEIVVSQTPTGPTNATGEFNDIVCFAAGTLISTPQGPVRVQDLQANDVVLTLDHGAQPIRWIGSSTLTAAQLATQPHLKPICIRAGALGEGFPSQDLYVSPQHRVLVSSAVAERMFDCKDVLIAAKKLLSLDGIDVVADAPDGAVYYHMLFDTHQIIWSNGAATESLFTGPEALKAVSDAARQEIRDLFPHCMTPAFAPVSARYIPKKGKRIQKLVDRHQANHKPLFDADVQETQPH